MAARIAAIAAALGTAAAITPADAHHSVGATVDLGTKVVQEMVLTRVDWINPHTWFHFDAEMPGGTRLKDVMIEWLSVNNLKQVGYPGGNFFSVGQAYMVTYNPNRDNTPGGNLVSLTDMRTGRVLDGHGPGDAPPAQ